MKLDISGSFYKMKFIFVLSLFYLLFFHLCFSQTEDKENLKKLTEYRQQHRKTVDGRLCAAAFVQEEHTYTDCTKATDPNGIKGKDWCYVEVQLIGKGSRDWDYCKGVINYDVVRSKARLFFQAKSNELTTAVTKLELENKKLVGIYEKYQKVCGTTSELVKKKIEEINDVAKNSSRNINKLLLLASSIGDTQNKYFELADQVEKHRKTSFENKKNCSVVNGYNVEEREDGLIGRYYDNAYFTGYPVSINNDKYINFIWDTGVPIENVPYQQFSVRWDGFLRIPQTDNYVITVEHDCGVRVYLDNTVIIVENMPYPKEDESEENRPVNVLPIEKMKTSVRKVHSEVLGLKGGEKYKFRVEYFHLSSVKYEHPDVAHLILFWKSDNIAEEIIPPNFFFQGNVSEPLKITELQGNEFDIFLLENGAYAFLNSLNHLIADVPAIHEKSKAIRTFNDSKRQTVSFKVNVHSVVFVAVPSSSDVPVNEVSKVPFERNKETLSVYSVGVNPEKHTREVFQIYSSDFDKGEVVVHFPKVVPHVIFVGHQKWKPGETCRGHVGVLSLTNSVHFDSCYTSSSESAKFDCKAGFSGNNEEKEFSTWITAKNKSLGQYISVDFKHEVEIHSFTFKTLNSKERLVTEVQLHFPHIKNPVVFSIIPGHHHYKLKKAVKTKTVKLVLSKVADEKSQSGGSVAFYGLSCVNHKNQKELTDKKSQYEMNILFRSKDINLTRPLNWHVDNGRLKETHGMFKYGWEKLPTPVPVNSLNKNDLHHAGISFHPAECVNTPCDTSNKWSIDLLHSGLYSVTVEIGSPTGKQEIHSIKVNDVFFINDIYLKPEQYTKVTSELTLKKDTSLDISTNTNTVLQSVQIVYLHE